MRQVFTGFLLVTLVSGATALAESRSAQMTVSAIVVARTVISVDAPTEVVVTEADAARGYVLIPHSIAFSVRSNSLGGYMLRFEAVQPVFSTASVSWGATEVLVQGGEAQIAQPYRKGITPYSATIRLNLAPGTQPGTYVWPLRIAADTL